MTTTPKESNYTPVLPSYSMLPSVDALTKHGLSKSAAIYMQSNHWEVPADSRPVFLAYYLLKWSASYFQSKLVQGTIERAGVAYQVIYYRCNAAMIGSDSRQLLLSFRVLQAEYKAQPIVLVTVA